MYEIKSVAGDVWIKKILITEKQVTVAHPGKLFGTTDEEAFDFLSKQKDVEIKNLDDKQTKKKKITEDHNG